MKKIINNNIFVLIKFVLVSTTSLTNSKIKNKNVILLFGEFSLYDQPWLIIYVVNYHFFYIIANRKKKN